MAKLTISEAAKLGYASRPTIYRAIKAGKLSAEVTPDGPRLDAAELRRVFGEPKTPAAKVEAATADQAKPDLSAEVARLQADLERERDRADRLLAMLETQNRLLAPPPPRSLWQRLFGRS